MLDRDASATSREGAQPLTLAPDRAAAVWWSVLGVLLIAAGGFFVSDGAATQFGTIFAWGVLVFFTVVGTYFLGQVFLPHRFTLDLAFDRLHARTGWIEVEVEWDDVHLARVKRIFGDPALELRVRRNGAARLADTEVVTIPLPVGADVAALHRFLEARLGRGNPLPPPGRVTPLDV